MVCCLGANAQPQAKSAKLCQDGAVKSAWNKTITKLPNDEARNVSTAVSSKREVACDTTILLELMLPWHPASAGVRSPTQAKNGETNG
jgi:hypothetical protein